MLLEDESVLYNKIEDSKTPIKPIELLHSEMTLVDNKVSQVGTITVN